MFQGYEAGLQKIYDKAGFSEIPHRKITEKTTTEAAVGNENTFSDLRSCNQVSQ